MNEASIARFREAQERREEEREQYVARLAKASSIREYLDIQRSHSSGPLQIESNMGYTNMKRAR